MLSAILVVMSVLASSEFGNGIRNVHAADEPIRPDRVNSGVAITAYENDYSNTGISVFFCLYDEDVSYYSDFSNRYVTPNLNVSSTNGVGKTTVVTPSSVAGKSVSEWILKKYYGEAATAGWGADYILVYQAVYDKTITYSPNGGTGTAINRTESVDLTSGDGSITLLSAAESGFKRANYKLSGWKENNNL